jgi:hypothetical protein
MTYSTTLAAPCEANDDQVLVSSAVGITDPDINKTTPCYLLVDTSQYAEYLLVDEGYVLGSLLVPVVRGFNGTIALPHAAGAPVCISDQISAGPFIYD